MRQLFLDRGLLAIKEVAQPQLSPGTVLVSVHYSCISSGTEQATIAAAQQSIMSNIHHKMKKVLEAATTHGIHATRLLIQQKLQGNIHSLGYSCSGQVIAVGSAVKSLAVGDYVACAGAGYAYHADIICVPEYLVARVNKQELLPVASMTTIGAIALQGIRRANLQLGDIVCVIGLGLLGQLTVQLAKQAGCIVFGIDIIDERLQLAQLNGADRVYHADAQQIIGDIVHATGQQGVDATIITAASETNALVHQAIDITRKKGKVVIVGDVGLQFERNPWYQKEIDVLMSCSYGPGRYDVSYEEQGIDYPYAYVRWTENRNMQAIVALFERTQLSLDSLSLEMVPFEQAIAAYEKIKEKKVLGAILSYNQSTALGHEKKNEQRKVSSEKDIRFKPARKDVIRVGVIGAGGFAKVTLLPILSSLKEAKVSAVVDVDAANAMMVARSYGVAHTFTDDAVLFAHDLVDAVVIASPHAFHAAQTIRALEQGKAVFLEKPMVTSFDQLEQFKEFFSRRAGMPLCVDYNRSFSPFMQTIKQVLVKRETPLIVHYRMNAGYIPADHWVQTSIGAGRIIGEACHILDLFSFLTDSKPVAVSVEAIHGARDALFPTDNFMVQIRFTDGSICSLLYTALGNAKLGKERMEIFFDNKTIVMDDYKSLTGYGVGSSFDTTVHWQDKGHKRLLHTFFERIKEPVFIPPISYERLITTAHLSLIVDQLACAGGGEKSL